MPPGQGGGLPGQQPPAGNPNLVPTPGQQPQPGAGNPLAVLAQLPPQALAYVQGLQRAAQQWEENRFFAQLGYQQWQQAQGQPRQGQGGPQQPGLVPHQGQTAAPQAPPNPFNVPRFDLANLAMIRRNPETGQYEAMAGAPPGLAQQAEAYQQAVVRATHEFFQDPRKAIEGLVREIAGEVADARGQQQLGAYQQQQFAQQTLQANAEWMYDRDAAGNVVVEYDVATGRQKQRLSAWGHEYARRVFALHQQGVTDGRLQHQLAIEGLQNLAYQMMARQQQVPAGQQPQGQQFLAQGQAGLLPGQGGTPAPSQQQPGVLPAPGPGTPNRPRSLREELSGVYSAHGMTDAAIAQGVQGGFGAGFSALNGAA